MKKRFFLYKFGVIPLMILFCSVNAQTTRISANLNTSSSKEVALNDNAKDKELPAFHNSRPGTKAFKNFNKTFKSTNNAGWFETGDAFIAQFKKDDIETKVFYDLKGRWVANVSAYQEDKLPKDIRHRVRSNYYDYNIFYVQEIIVKDKTAYLVKIEDRNSIKTIRIADGEMDEYQTIEKQK